MPDRSDRHFKISREGNIYEARLSITTVEKTITFIYLRGRKNEVFTAVKTSIAIGGGQVTDFTGEWK